MSQPPSQGPTHTTSAGYPDGSSRPIVASPTQTGKQLSAGNIDARIEAYEGRMRAWMIDRARDIAKHQDGAITALFIIMAYFENHEIFVSGTDSKNHSRSYFLKGFRSVFSGSLPPRAKSADVATFMWEEVRNGLYHQGITKPPALLSNGPSAITSVDCDAKGRLTEVVIDVHKFIDVVETHLTSYLTKLRTPSEVSLRSNFEAAWSSLYGSP